MINIDWTVPCPHSVEHNYYLNKEKDKIQFTVGGGVTTINIMN